MLAPQLARGNDDARRQMSEPDRRLCLVDVLAAGAAGTEGLNLTFPQ